MKKSNQYGSKLKEYRLSLGLTLRQAGDLINRRERVYANFENGKRNMERWEYIGICEVLKEGKENVVSE